MQLVYLAVLVGTVIGVAVLAGYIVMRLTSGER
jgi:uncharacterized membrane-anchored protein YhcB (DUF1043 family)